MEEQAWKKFHEATRQHEDRTVIGTGNRIRAIRIQKRLYTE